MATNEDNNTRGHELYLKYILLLKHASPLALKGVFNRETAKRRDMSYTGVNSWDLTTLCSELEKIKATLSERDLKGIRYVHDQLKDFQTFAQSKSLNFHVFGDKWNPLHDVLVEIIEDIDDSNRYKCTRMMFSLQEDIKIDSELIEEIKQTESVSAHIEIANKTFPNVVACAREEKEQNESPVQFIETYSDTYVNVGDSAVLVCKLSREVKPVFWIKDNKLLAKSETLKFVTDCTSHWLVICKLTKEDAGKYSCICEDSKTSANLTVTEKALKVTTGMHVEQEDVKENMEISLICKVNMSEQKPLWQHNNEEIRMDFRRVALSKGMEHKLIIRNVCSEDEGRYVIVFGTVTSSTCVSLNGKSDILLRHKQQLKDDQYRNWVRGALGLKYLKVGLEGFLDRLVEKQHEEILKEAQTKSNYEQCHACTNENLIPHGNGQCKGPERKQRCICVSRNGRPCPNGGFCGIIYDQIVGYHLHRTPTLKNTQVQSWITSPWSIATTYMNEGYRGKVSAKEIDCSGLLSIFKNNMYCSEYVDIQNIEEAIQARNELLHNSNYVLEEKKLNEYIDVFTEVLKTQNVSDRMTFQTDELENAIRLLEKLQGDQIDINISKDIEQLEHSFRQHSMTEEAEICQKKLKTEMEKLKQTMKAVDLVFELQNGRKTKVEKEAPLVVDLCLQVHTQDETTALETNGCIFSIFKNEVDPYFITSTTREESTNPAWEQVRQSVLRILGYIRATKNTTICNVVDKTSSSAIQINCFSFDAVENLLVKLIRNTIKEEVEGLWESLKSFGKQNIYDITLSCKPESLDAIKNQLELSKKRGDPTCAKHQDLKIEWYCQEKNVFFCNRCKDEEHGSCIGLIPFKADIMAHEKPLTERHKKVEHNVRLDVDDTYSNIHGSCVIPGGNIILLDNGNRRIKKFNIGFRLVSHFDLPKLDQRSRKNSSYGVCYIGNDRVAVSMCNSRILFVNASGDMELENEEKLDHECFGLACYGGTLYVADDNTVYAYSSTSGKKKGTLYKSKNNAFSFKHIAVSSDGEKIYIAASEGGLVTINRNGSHLSTLKNEILPCAENVCVFGDGTVLVCSKSSQSVLQIDVSGNRILGTVITSVAGCLQSLYFDRYDFGLSIGLRDSDTVIAYN